MRSPEVSVVVPTWRRTDLLNRCLAALAAQRMPPNAFEIIVCSDGESASTRRLCETWQRRLEAAGGPALACVALQRHAGPAAARNAAARRARGPVLAFTDDDTVPDANWLASGCAAVEAGADAVWGSVVVPLGGTPTDYERDAARLAHAPFVTANCFCRREVFESVGCFDERFEAAWREDSDLYFRLLDSGATVVHVPSAVVVHPVRPGPWAVAIRQQSRVRFDALLFKKHPYRYRERIRRQPRWDYYAIVLALAAVVGGMLLGAGDVAIAAGLAWAAGTAWFCLSRLQATRRDVGHVLEMVVTSAAIPPLAVFWRAVGAVRFRVLFL